VNRLLAGEGCLIRGAEITNAVLGQRSVVSQGARLEGMVCLGNSFYDGGEGADPTNNGGNAGSSRPALGIGPGARLRRVIVDESVRIGRDCRIGVDDRERPDGDYEGYSVRDGIVVLHCNAVIAQGAVL